ncbi:MAG: hypothetical protein C4576_29130 [Desulfobacteraceae bacterium]|nr:MAG: hypothetical protein C4576_29130 [Desulfobacteraceae bacterium]
MIKNKKQACPTVYIVHCVDTEGPLYESLPATFERIKHIFHLDLPASRELLSKLQAGEVDLGGLETAVQQVVNPQILRYNDTWDKIDLMLNHLLSAEFRNQMLDSSGNGWVFNWFCVDHVDYEVNPRRRDIGYHNIFDHYRHLLERLNVTQDGLQFHYHPHPFKKHAHLCATHWWSASNSLYQILSRRILDRQWFPSANRPGFQVNRPDSHWFLEQFIPFDFASLAAEANLEDEQQFDFANGRSGDWRRAPITWTPYNPSHDDYQRPGRCRRWIARCLNVGTRAYLLTENEVRRAFREACEEKPVVMSFASHDFRDLSADVNYVRGILQKVAPEFPQARFEFAEALSAMRKSLSLTRLPACSLKLSLQSVNHSAHVLTIRSDIPIFGPQPFLAMKTVTDSYYHDNLDFQKPGVEWTYVFDEETFPLRAIESIGVAANNAYGVSTVATMDVQSGRTAIHIWNEGDQ